MAELAAGAGSGDPVRRGAVPPELARSDDPTFGTIPARLARIAEAQPDRPALSDGIDEGWTYGELVEATASASRWIRAEHPGDERPIALLMPHSPLAVACELAIIGAGRAVVPLDPTLSAERLGQLLSETDPAAIVCAPRYGSLAQQTRPGSTVHLWPSLPEGPATASGAPVRDTDPAFLLFTSGSTGRPKGVLSNHRPFLSSTAAMVGAGVLGHADRLAMITPLGLAGAATQIMGGLLAGAEVCTFPLRDSGMSAFVDWMRAARITAFTTVPTLARATAHALDGRPLADLRTLWIGGEVLQKADIPLLRSMGGSGARLAHVYASTETMLMSLGVIPPDADPSRMGPITLGEPVGDMEFELRPLDDEPDTDLGEIVVHSRVLTDGYWRNPELTLEKFSFDPQLDRMTYRTGDLGRRTPDGIEIVGRTDSMVKVRGRRVELGLVEAALRAAPDVADAAALASTAPNGDTVLVAHVAGVGAAVPDPRAVKGHLHANLPRSMVPSVVVVHGEIPRMPNGKVDRHALTQSAPAGDGRIVPPRSDVEVRLAKLLMDMLDLTSIDMDRDFFEVGGDSLMAIELLVRLEAEFGVTLPMSSWIGLTTIAELASRIEDGSPATGSTAVEIQSGDAARPPLVLANDLHGTAFRFRHLAAALGADQEVWGLDSPLLEGGAEMPRTMEEVAHVHVEDLLRAVPEGPYHLAGYSWGAVLVVEMTRQLEARGLEVGFLGLLDFGPVHLRHTPGRSEGPRPPGGWALRAPSQLSPVGKLRHHVRRVTATPRGERLEYLSRAVDGAKPYDELRALWDLRRHGRVRASLRGAHCWYREMDLANAYRFPHLERDAVVFVCDQTRKGRMSVSRRLDFESATDPLLGWQDVFAGDLTIVPLVGHHNDLVEEPYVDGVGAAVRRAFDDWLLAHAGSSAGRTGGDA